MFPVIPENVQIEISNRCNLQCPLCPKGRNEITRNNLDMDIGIFKDILSKLSEYDPKIQLWNYGEPFLHHNIHEIIKSIDQTFTNCSISTNGHVMTDELAKLVVESGITEIIFAIDGLTQNTYEQYRRGGSLELVLSNLEKIIEQKRKANSNITITVQFLILKHNFSEISKLGEFFYPIGVDQIKAKSVMLMDNKSDVELAKIAKKYLYLDYPGERYAITDNQLSAKGEPTDECPVIENSFVITTDGEVLPCCWDYKSEYPLSSYEKWLQIKRMVNSGKPPEMCNKCPIRYNHDFSWEWDKVPGVIYK